MYPKHRDICREFFSKSHRKMKNVDEEAEETSASNLDSVRSSLSSSDGDPEEIAYIDATHLSDSPRSDIDFGSFHKDIIEARVETVKGYDGLSDGECDVMVTLPRQHLEYQDSSYFHEEGSYVDTPRRHRTSTSTTKSSVGLDSSDYDSSSLPPLSARDSSRTVSPISILHGRSSSCTSERKLYEPRPPSSQKLRKTRSVESSSLPEDQADSGYASSSVCLSSRLTGDRGTDSIGLDSVCSAFSDPDKVETASVSSSTSSRPSSGRVLNRRQFHQGNFVRYRYPSQFHSTEDKTKSGNVKNTSKHTRFDLPSSLKPNTRYNKEPLVQRCSSQGKAKRQWPKPPRYPPKARHAGVECEIIKLVEKLDVGVQCTPPTKDDSCQCAPNTKESHTQYPRVKRKETPSQTVIKEYRDEGLQIQPETRSRMVDTDVTVNYRPDSMLRPHVCSQCGREDQAKNVNYWVTSNLPQ